MTSPSSSSDYDLGSFVVVGFDPAAVNCGGIAVVAEPADLDESSSHILDVGHPVYGLQLSVERAAAWSLVRGIDRNVAQMLQAEAMTEWATDVIEEIGLPSVIAIEHAQFGRVGMASSTFLHGPLVHWATRAIPPDAAVLVSPSLWRQYFGVKGRMTEKVKRETYMAIAARYGFSPDVADLGKKGSEDAVSAFLVAAYAAALRPLSSKPSENVELQRRRDSSAMWLRGPLANRINLVGVQPYPIREQKGSYVDA